MKRDTYVLLGSYTMRRLYRYEHGMLRGERVINRSGDRRQTVRPTLIVVGLVYSVAIILSAIIALFLELNGIHWFPQPLPTDPNPVDQIVARLDCQKGSVDFDRPTHFDQGQWFTLRVTASYASPAAEPYPASTHHETVRANVCSHITARLDGPDYEYHLDPAYEETQLLPTRGETKWQWEVAPTQHRTLKPLYLNLYTGEANAPASILMGQYPVIASTEVNKNLPYDTDRTVGQVAKTTGVSVEWLYAAVGGLAAALIKPSYTFLKRRVTSMRNRRIRRKKRELALIQKRQKEEQVLIQIRLGEVNKRLAEEEVAYEINRQRDERAEDLKEQIANPYFRRPDQASKQQN